MPRSMTPAESAELSRTGLVATTTACHAGHSAGSVTVVDG